MQQLSNDAIVLFTFLTIIITFSSQSTTKRQNKIDKICLKNFLNKNFRLERNDKRMNRHRTLDCSSLPCGYMVRQLVLLREAAARPTRVNRQKK